MKFSVIIPVYNSEQFLDKCISSIIDQDYSDYELILVDDGSTDNSIEVIKKYQNFHSNIVFVQQENAGPSAARNTGLSLAKGNYVLFVDSDDWVSDDYFATLDSLCVKQYDIVFFGSRHVGNNGEVLKEYVYFETDRNTALIDMFISNYYHADNYSCTNKMYSKKILEENHICFREGTVVEEDLQFVLNVIDHSNLSLSIPNILYCYNRRTKGSVTTKFNPLKFDKKIDAYKEEMRLAKKWNSEILMNIYNDNYLTYISACINNLMYRECPMSTKEKKLEITRYFNHEVTQQCIKNHSVLSKRSLFMKILIRLNLIRISFYLHKCIFVLKGRS